MELARYRLLEPLATTHDHALFLATSATHAGQFVVRICTAELDAEDRQRYLEQLRSLRGSPHPGLCEVVDVGQSGDHVFAAMPYYRGGTLQDVLARGISMTKLLRTTKEICTALASLHRRGLVHGDIKPANVVFDDTGAAVLIDGAYLAPLNLPIPFTIGYGAPELVRCEPLNERCDIFSLGMLLVRVLVGDLPWHVEGSDEPRTRSISDALPAFAPQHENFVELVERMVAFAPKDRLSDILTVRDALDRIEITAELHTVAIKSDLISTAEIKATLPTLSSGERARSDGRRIFGRAVLLHWFTVLGVCIAGVWASALGLYELPVTKRALANLGIAENLALVEARLNAEALVADPIQNLQSIVAAYEAVLVHAPDDTDAMASIAAARARWENGFQEALTKNELNVAQNRLNDLLASYPDDASLLVIYEELQTRRHALSLQSDALALLGVTGYESAASADMALHAFREVLRLYPASVEASRELNKLAAHFSSIATHEIELGDIQAAMDSLSKASLANPNYGELAKVREQIQRATTLRDEITALLAEAHALHRSGRLISPPERNAAMLYHRVLTTDPDNEIALRGLGTVSQLVVEQFDADLEARRIGVLRQRIERAKTVGLYPGSIMHMESALASELENIAQAADLVVVAERLIADGYITVPPERNAAVILQQAYRLDPSNLRIKELLNACETRLRAVAADAQAFGLKDVAATYMTYAEQVKPNNLL